MSESFNTKQFSNKSKHLDYSSLAKRLGMVEHFRRLSESDRKEIVSAGLIEQHPAGSVIFHEGEPCAGLFVLFKGQVNLSMLGLQGLECIISVIRPVIMFNEVPVLDGGPNPVTARAAADCVTWRLSHERYMMLMKDYPTMGIGLLNVLAARHRLMLSRFEDLLSRTVQARTAKVLLEVSANGQEEIDRRRYANQELAARAATCPEAFSRSLRRLRDLGVIDSDRWRITVNCPNKLAEVAMIEPIGTELYSEN